MNIDPEASKYFILNDFNYNIERLWNCRHKQGIVAYWEEREVLTGKAKFVFSGECKRAPTIGNGQNPSETGILEVAL